MINRLLLLSYKFVWLLLYLRVEVLNRLFETLDRIIFLIYLLFLLFDPFFKDISGWVCLTKFDGQLSILDLELRHLLSLCLALLSKLLKQLLILIDILHFLIEVILHSKDGCLDLLNRKVDLRAKIDPFRSKDGLLEEGVNLWHGLYGLCLCLRLRVPIVLWLWPTLKVYDLNVFIRNLFRQFSMLDISRYRLFFVPIEFLNSLLVIFFKLRLHCFVAHRLQRLVTITLQRRFQRRSRNRTLPLIGDRRNVLTMRSGINWKLLEL